MTVGIQCGSIITEIGSASFLNCFFSTVAVVLEGGVAGSRFPAISTKLYDGTLSVGEVATALEELKHIQQALAEYPPSAVVWDAENRCATPPWGDTISAEITNMSNYFVTSTGRDMLLALIEVFEHAIKRGYAISIV